jgi:hypothetical protein
MRLSLSHGREGRMKRRIVPGGILALSLAVVLLAATASTASAESQWVEGRYELMPGIGLFPWNCPPPSTPPTTVEQIPEGCLPSSGGFAPSGEWTASIDFGDRQLGTTSTAQRLALGVLGNESFNPRISVSGDYAQTNNCPPTLSVNGGGQIQGCLITVTFTPTSTGPKHGTLSTGTGGPTAALVGNGVTTPTPSPDLELSGKKKQHPTIRHEYTGCGGAPAKGEGSCGPCDFRADCAVKVKASCGADACTARADGKLTKVKKDKLDGARGIEIVPGGTRSLHLRLTKKMREKALKAIDKGMNVQAKVTVKATDEVGNVATAKRTIRLK